MLLENRTFAQLTKDSLYQLIAMNPATVSRSALSHVFGHDDKTRADLETFLSELKSEQKIVPDGGRGFRATKPWSDIAYAVVGPVTEGRRKPVPLKLQNMPQDVSVPVVMSWAEFHRHGLKEGDRIVAGLTRGTNAHNGLYARFISHTVPDRPFPLAGIFNYKAGHFIPLDRRIKTALPLNQEPDPDSVPRHFLAALPADFDIRHPVAVVAGDQTRDAHTGQPISWIVTRKHEIAHAHPEDVLKEARRINRRKPDFAGRADLRRLDLVTVDPLGSEDLDDGFAVEIGGNGYSLYTAIADVAAFVRYNTSVDREAYRRGVTYYLDDYTAHMLPAVLSTRKLSLRAHEDRLAIVVRQDLGWDCQRKGFDIMPAIVRSREQLSYGQFYDLLERDDPRFRLIATIHDTRRRNKMNVELDTFRKEDPDSFISKSIVETLMVQTNSLIAQFLKSAGIPFLSRNFEHNASSDEQGKRLAPRAYYASYHLGHAGLGLRHYAQGTSPIRRYPDLLNQRALHTAFGNAKIGIHEEEIEQLDDIAAHLNERRRVERNVAHDAERYHAIADLVRLQAAPVRMGIYEVGHDYVEVTVAQTGVRQRLHSSMMPDQWRIDSENRELVLMDDLGCEVRRYSRNDTLLGQVYDVDPAQALWKVDLMPPEPALRMPPMLAAKPA